MATLHNSNSHGESEKGSNYRAIRVMEIKNSINQGIKNVVRVKEIFIYRVSIGFLILEMPLLLLILM